jgi:hypothetical protein
MQRQVPETAEAQARRVAQPETTSPQPKQTAKPVEGPSLEVQETFDRLERARSRLLSSAIAFCDGAISAGQLRAVRELLREQELRVLQLTGRNQAPFVEEQPPPRPADAEVIPQQAMPPTPVAAPPLPAQQDAELDRMLQVLQQKMARLEKDFQHGRVNASQYSAIRRHYMEQREVALRLRVSHPESDRWRVVMEEGKTSFLLQLNETICYGMAIYDVKTRERLYWQGRIPPSAEEAMAILQTFGPTGTAALSGRMLATTADDGTALLLIPGKYTAALVVFSQHPPGWQARALLEVHRNFEAANTPLLARGERRGLLYPDLTRFIRS